MPFKFKASVISTKNMSHMKSWLKSSTWCNHHLQVYKLKDININIINIYQVTTSPPIFIPSNLTALGGTLFFQQKTLRFPRCCAVCRSSSSPRPGNREGRFTVGSAGSIWANYGKLWKPWTQQDLNTIFFSRKVGEVRVSFTIIYRLGLATSSKFGSLPSFLMVVFTDFQAAALFGAGWIPQSMAPMHGSRAWGMWLA